jgi:hypothetical protein
MPCDTRRKAGQSITERKKEIRDSVASLAFALEAGKARVKVGPQGAIVFEAWTDRNDITDACAYRQLMAMGSSLVKAKIAQAERLAGRPVSKQMIAQGAHSHDGGATWHSHKG